MTLKKRFLAALIGILLGTAIAAVLLHYSRSKTFQVVQPPDSACDVVIVTDPATETPDQAAVYTDQATREYLDAGRHELRIVTGKTVSEKNSPPRYLLPYLTKAKGQTCPFVVVGRAGSVLASFALPSSGQGLIDRIEHASAGPRGGSSPEIWAGGQWRKLACLPAKPGAAKRWQTEGTQPNEPLIPAEKWQSVDFAYLAASTLDQNGYSCCCACADVQALITARNRAGLKPVKLSVVDCYARGNGGRDQGMTIEDAVRISLDGVCSTQTANLWGVSKTGHKGDWKTDRLRNRVLYATWCPDVEHIASALQRRRPVVFGAMVDDTFTPDKNGVIGPKRGNPRGGHAMYLVGMRQAEPGEAPGWYFLDCNSWGTQWGQKGRAWIHQSWIDPRFGAFAIAAVTSPENDPLVSERNMGEKNIHDPIFFSSIFFSEKGKPMHLILFCVAAYLSVGLACESYEEKRFIGATAGEAIVNTLRAAILAPITMARTLWNCRPGASAAIAALVTLAALGLPAMAGPVKSPCDNGRCPVNARFIPLSAATAEVPVSAEVQAPSKDSHEPVLSNARIRPVRHAVGCAIQPARRIALHVGMELRDARPVRRAGHRLLAGVRATVGRALRVAAARR